MNVVATRQQDMVSGLLAEFALGGLSKPVRVLVESHLELSPAGETWVRDLDRVRQIVQMNPSAPGEVPFKPDVFDPVEPAAFSDHAARLQATLEEIDAADDAADGTYTPRALHDMIGMAIEDVPWKKVMPGLSEYRTPDVDGCEVSLLRIDGGKTMPVHTHHGSEITLVLQGGFSDQNGHYGVGDIAYADDDVNHRPVADEGEVCICFAVVDAPVELTGPIGRFVNSFRR